MVHSQLALVRTALASLLICNAAARADFFSSHGADPPPIPFTVQARVSSDRVGPDATIFHADPPGTGYVQLLQPSPDQHFSGSGSIIIPMIAFSSAPADRPDQFTPIPGKPVYFQVELLITDDSAPGAGPARRSNTVVGLAGGYFVGSLSAHHSNLRAVRDWTKGDNNGDHVFSVFFPPNITGFDVAAPGSPHPSSFVVNIKAEDMPPPAPEPSTLALAGLGIYCVVFRLRRRRSHSDHSASKSAYVADSSVA